MSNHTPDLCLFFQTDMRTLWIRDSDSKMYTEIQMSNCKCMVLQLGRIDRSLVSLRLTCCLSPYLKFHRGLFDFLWKSVSFDTFILGNIASTDQLWMNCMLLEWCWILSKIFVSTVFRDIKKYFFLSYKFQPFSMKWICDPPSGPECCAFLQDR